MNAIKSLPMSIEDKQDFANVMLENSGNGGGGSEGESSIEYLDVSGLEDITMVACISFLARSKSTVGTPMIGIFPTAYLYAVPNIITAVDVLAVAIDLSMEICPGAQGSIISIGDFLAMMEEDISSIPRITKEQFYSLE